ncbi:hypothetical protein FEM03_02485 [Phragmitibacter flavus]|uniref:Uncharacterized protein n=1 Tax=Phragmitibacter flavus TaxID=2576071 RepID=A0A5R8KIV8_9BACT|nr:hypothetical protein [Phragmitibacter flavus]TLD72244.1 hypothetical protein FEM03_02485 [Phragmitibacter flavus]
MKLLEGQLWKVGDIYWRILHRDNYRVVYKAMKDPETKEGEEHELTKKEFCRLIKKAELLTPANPRG